MEKLIISLKLDEERAALMAKYLVDSGSSTRPGVAKSQT
jgi:hypothetical protein